MTRQDSSRTEAAHARVHLVAVGPHDAMPCGVPLHNVRLPSAQQARAQQWLKEHALFVIFVVPGREEAAALISDGARPHPGLELEVTAAEYEAVLALVPH